MIFESITIIGFAILIDLIFGDPKNRYHPTAWIGTLIAKFTTLAKHQNPIFEKNWWCFTNYNYFKYCYFIIIES